MFKTLVVKIHKNSGARYTLKSAWVLTASAWWFLNHALSKTHKRHFLVKDLILKISALQIFLSAANLIRLGAHLWINALSKERLVVSGMTHPIKFCANRSPSPSNKPSALLINSNVALTFLHRTTSQWLSAQMRRSVCHKTLESIVLKLKSIKSVHYFNRRKIWWFKNRYKGWGSFNLIRFKSNRNAKILEGVYKKVMKSAQTRKFAPYSTLIVQITLASWVKINSIFALLWKFLVPTKRTMTSPLFSALVKTIFALVPTKTVHLWSLAKTKKWLFAQMDPVKSLKQIVSKVLRLRLYCSKQEHMLTV